MPVTILDARKKKIKIVVNLEISSLTRSEIHKLLDNFCVGWIAKQVVICVDSVIGLPKGLNVSISEILERVQDFEYQGKKWGALTAFYFFNSFLKPPGPSRLINLSSQNLETSIKNDLPQRKAEVLTKANSVFKLKPFQRNIGCGSFRVLKDLSKDTSWFSIWPFQSSSKKIQIAEGYPSFFWKKFLHLSRRDLLLLSKKFPQFEFNSIDHADSFVLAWGAYETLKSKNWPSKLPSISKKEGWILGFE